MWKDPSGRLIATGVNYVPGAMSQCANSGESLVWDNGGWLGMNSWRCEDGACP
jgi:hypothetical protein